MTAFPLPMLRGLSAEEATAVQHWWDGLTEEDRRGLLHLWDVRGNQCRFSWDDGDSDSPGWQRLPFVGVEFLPADETQSGDDWRPEYFDHLLSNPELVATELPHRQFHIGCTAHPKAREALRAGFIPADFVCPLASATCPLRRLLALAPGLSARLVWHPGENRDARS